MRSVRSRKSRTRCRWRQSTIAGSRKQSTVPPLRTTLRIVSLSRTQPATTRPSLPLDIRFANDAAILVVLLADMGREIIEAGANRIEAHIGKLRLDVRHLHCGLEPGCELRGDILRCLCRRKHSKPDRDFIVLV